MQQKTTTERAEESVHTMETFDEASALNNAEAIPLVKSNAGEIVGMVTGGIMAALVIISLVRLSVF